MHEAPATFACFAASSNAGASISIKVQRRSPIATRCHDKAFNMASCGPVLQGPDTNTLQLRTSHDLLSNTVLQPPATQKPFHWLWLTMYNACLKAGPQHVYHIAPRTKLFSCELACNCKPTYEPAATQHATLSHAKISRHEPRSEPLRYSLVAL